MNVYQALDNNGELYLLSTSKKYAKASADSHQKGVATKPFQPGELLEFYPAHTQVYDGKGRNIGTLAKLAT